MHRMLQPVMKFSLFFPYIIFFSCLHEIYKNRFCTAGWSFESVCVPPAWVHARINYAKKTFKAPFILWKWHFFKSHCNKYPNSARGLCLFLSHSRSLFLSCTNIVLYPTLVWFLLLYFHMKVFSLSLLTSPKDEACGCPKATFPLDRGAWSTSGLPPVVKSHWTHWLSF